jgi:hypothetical protein
MRVRILKHPPASYGIDGESLLIGRVYNLAAELASALLLEGCAEVYDAMTDQREEHGGFSMWQANEPAKRKGKARSNTSKS